MCAAALLRAAPEPPVVRVWQDTLRLPTYVEGAANPNAPFDLFTFGRFNYPYPLRDSLTDTRETVTWRSLHLENEYLRLTVLPDLGGHIYGCLDKRTGQQMFYANSAIKKALIGYRGAWAAFGVEFNYPVSHNWASMSPVDFATARHADGSASIFVGNTDQVYRGRWRVELRLQPSKTLLEQKVELYNSTDVRHRYYWWTNGAVQAWEDSQLVYPTELMATHGFTSIEPWPDRSAGPRHERDPQPDRRAGVAVHVRHSRRIRRCLPSQDEERHGAHRRSRPAAGPQGVVVGQRSRRRDLARSAVGRQQRLRGIAGGPLPESGDVRVSRAAGLGSLHGILAACARSRRDHARHSGCGGPPRTTHADAAARGARRHTRAARRAVETESWRRRGIDRPDAVAANGVAQGDHRVSLQHRARRSHRTGAAQSHRREVRSYGGDGSAAWRAAQHPPCPDVDQLAG